jgi:hypothetical protein
MTEREFKDALRHLISQARTSHWGTDERLAGLFLEGFAELAGMLLLRSGAWPQGGMTTPADLAARQDALLRIAREYLQGLHGSY